MIETRIAFMSVGSNLGDREANLKGAIDGMCEAGIAVQRVSSIFETEPVGFLDQPWFLNIAVEGETRLGPRELLACLQKIEAAHGRVRLFPGAPRTLDVDILLFNNLIIDEPGLQIPHPRMTQRRFVLEPLAQIAPEVLHPVLKKTVRDLLTSCPDSSRVSLHSVLSG